MGKNTLKCHANKLDCFAICGETCQLLISFTKHIDGDPMPIRMHGTKFINNECPFYKTIEEAGGTYSQLCFKYPVSPDAWDPK